MERLEQIIMATLKLASKAGLGNVSLQMIADEVGIKKASLFNHIESKDDLINKMYEYLRLKSKENIKDISIDYSLSLEEILYNCYLNYLTICNDSNLNMFYKIIYSERAFNNNARQIVNYETEKMVSSTKLLFMKLIEIGKMKNVNLDIDSIEFAFTIHNFIDYEIDNNNLNIISKYNAKDYINSFARRYK